MLIPRKKQIRVEEKIKAKLHKYAEFINSSESYVVSKARQLVPIITHCGRICLGRKKINFSAVFAGQAVGIKEVEEGIWLVSFMDYDLGYIDLEERTLQPLDNPFGPKV
jgi:hypothetical protein